jgi:hypothetical protein
MIWHDNNWFSHDTGKIHTKMRLRDIANFTWIVWQIYVSVNLYSFDTNQLNKIAKHLTLNLYEDVSEGYR